MEILKCKMCGGNLEVQNGDLITTCPYCGTQQTLPDLKSQKFANIYNKMNTFRQNQDYDKAINLCEQVLNNEAGNSESYWQMLLCRYGIEYVEDPATHKQMPTINRMQYSSILKDKDYLNTLKYASSEQKAIYEIQAKEIGKIQKDALKIIKEEKPFDVFICYKETDENGKRTEDSVIANDLYYQLTDAGFKVFFAKITLENKLGSAYEPYIFSALNTAKVMVVIGTKPEYLNAVWVKNEWSRFLSLAKSDPGKALIPAYKGMDPYDLPEEFAHLQAQDMSKIGFMQDLIRGIKKLKSGKKKKHFAVFSAVAAVVIIIGFGGFLLYTNKAKEPDNQNFSANQVSSIDNSTSANSEIKIKSILLTPNEKCAVIQGHYGNFQATVLPANVTEKPVWSSTDSNVIEIRDNNQVFAKGVGEADIIVSNSEGSITTRVSVKVYKNDNFAIETDKSKWVVDNDGLWIPLKGNWDTYSCYDFSFTKSDSCLYPSITDRDDHHTYLLIGYGRYDNDKKVTSGTVGFKGKFNGSVSKNVKPISDSVTIDLSIFNKE